MKRLFLVLSLFLGILNCAAFQAGSGAELDAHRARKALYTLHLKDGVTAEVDGYFIQQFQALADMVEVLKESDAPTNEIYLKNITLKQIQFLKGLITKIGTEYKKLLLKMDLLSLISLWKAIDFLEIKPYVSADGSKRFNRKSPLLMLITKQIIKLDPKKEESEAIFKMIENNNALYYSIIDFLFENAPMQPSEQLKISPEKNLNVGISQNRKRLLSGFRYNRPTYGFKIWNIEDFNDINIITQHKFRDNQFQLSSSALNSDGTHIAITGRIRSTIYIISAETGAVLKIIDDRNTGIPYLLTFSHDGTKLLEYIKDDFVQDNDTGSINIYNVQTGELISSALVSLGRIVTVNRDLTRIFYSSDHYSIEIRDTATGAIINTINNCTNRHTKEITAFALNPEETHIATCSRDETTKLWDIETGRLIKTFKNDTVTGKGGITALAFNPQGTKIATASQISGIIDIWDIKTGKLTATSHVKPTDSINALLFNSDGTQLLVGIAGKNPVVLNSVFQNLTKAEAYALPLQKVLAIFKD